MEEEEKRDKIWLESKNNHKSCRLFVKSLKMAIYTPRNILSQILIPGDLSFVDTSSQSHKPVVFCMRTGLSRCRFYQQQAGGKETKVKICKTKDCLNSV